MVAPSQARPEFSRLLSPERVGETELTQEISAGPDERAALAERFGLLSLERLDATIELRRANGGDLIRLSGRLFAEVRQACVVTLEPVTSHLEEDFTLLYTLCPGPPRPGGAEVVVEVEEEEPPEPIGPGGIDLGEAVAQQLALALDPYPRAPGARLPEAAGPDAAAEPGAESPFAVLERLKRGA